MNELDTALDYIHHSLPYTPRWIAVITVDGNLMGYYGLEKADEDRVTAMLAASEALNGRILNELNNGKFRYGIIGAEKGISLIVALGEIGILGINFDQIASFDKLFNALPEVLSPLLALLKLN